MPNKKRVIIAAICSRPYVQAAVSAGFEVIAIDCFADVDTRRLAKQVHLVGMQNEQLDQVNVINVLAELDTTEIIGLCYGAGMEMQASVIRQIGEYCNILGNDAETVAQTKTPDYFYALCDDLQISHPEVSFNRPERYDGWLQKTVGASGGAHIERFTHLTHANEQQIYFQKEQEGKSISCLFLANANDVQIIGFNTQWVDGIAAIPFRYGGAASNAEITALAISRFTTYVRELTAALGLLGLNSCDAICDGDNVFILEVNPRLSATIDLYASNQQLMAWHVQATQGKVLADLQMHAKVNASQAHQVLYAKQGFNVALDVQWPIWVADLPEAGSHIVKGMPICTVNAQAKTAALAKQLVQDRAAALHRQFLN